MHIRLCKRMGISYRELEATPAIVVQDWVLDMVAEGAAGRIKEGWKNR